MQVAIMGQAEPKRGRSFASVQNAMAIPTKRRAEKEG